jgi:hypothetical protein
MDNLEFEAQDVSVSAQSGRLVYVTVGKPDVGTILEAIGIKEIVSHFDSGQLLDQIGKDMAIEHFDIIEKEEE